MPTVTPGLDTAMVIQSVATYGARQGHCTAVGIAIGCLCRGATAAFRLSAMLARWPLAFDLLRAIGALYIGWLGVGLLRNPRQTFDAYVAGRAASARAGDALRTGFLTNILNPKVGLFYLMLLLSSSRAPETNSTPWHLRASTS
nr:LysE family translocator [Sphingobium ummariense]